MESDELIKMTRSCIFIVWGKRVHIVTSEKKNMNIEEN